MKFPFRRESRSVNSVENISQDDGSILNWNFIKPNTPNKDIATVDNAHVFDDIYTCINVLSDDIAKLPVKIYKKSDGAITSLDDHPISEVLKRRTNPHMSPYTWKKLAIVDLCIYGNHFSYIDYDGSGKVRGIIPVPYNNVSIYLYDDGSIVYNVKSGNGQEFNIPEEDMIHVKGFSRDGFVGKSPIGVLAERAEANSVANKYNLGLLSSGATPSGILSMQGQLSGEARDRIKEEWKKSNSDGSVAVLSSGMEYSQLGLTQKDMQFIESQKFNQEKIAAIFKIPLHKLNRLERATYSNIEHQSLEYVKNTLQPIIVQIEEELNYKLFLQQEKTFYVKFNVESELRGDSKTKAEVHQLNLRNGIKTLNELRAEEELSPYDGDTGNKPLMTLNYTFLEDLVTYQMSKYKTAVDNVNETDDTEDEDGSKVKGGDDDG